MRITLLCALAFAACDPQPIVVARPTAPPTAFGCTGPTETPSPSPSPPTGHVEVKVIGDGPDGTRLQVSAESASAAQLAVRIGEALKATTRAEHELDNVSVTLYAPDVTIDLLAALLRTQKIRVSKGDWDKARTLSFRLASPFETNEAEDPSRVTSRVIAGSASLPADQLAALFCRSAASSAGSAQVVGNRVVITDHAAHLDNFASMLDQLGH